MRLRLFTLAALLLSGVGLASSMLEAGAQKPAGGVDTILINGKILSADTTFTIYDALAIRGDRIAAAGITRDIRALADERTRVVDLGGRTVIPGLIDSHMHAI